MDYCGLTLDSPFLLAPMAGITDSAFRSVCAREGASLTYTEMVSARALVYGDRKSATLMAIEPDHRPCALQLFGSDPSIMAKGARMAYEMVSPELIDLNMGCPVPKIVGNGEGSALMREPLLAGRIIAAVSAAVPVPVTVKFRKGFSAGENTALGFARMAERAGAAAVCVHGRTRSQMYSGESDRAVIGEVKAALRIPVVASGDAKSAGDCLDILRETGCDAVMIARGALGNPLIFRACRALWDGKAIPDATADDLLNILEQHVTLTCARKGEGRAMPELRKHALWYLGRLRGAKPFKAAMSRVNTEDDFRAALNDVRAAGLSLKADTALPPT